MTVNEGARGRDKVRVKRERGNFQLLLLLSNTLTLPAYQLDEGGEGGQKSFYVYWNDF